MGRSKIYLLLIFFCLAFSVGNAQDRPVYQDTVLEVPGYEDTMTTGFRQRVERYRQGLVRIRQQNLLDEIRSTISRAEAYQKSTINSEQIVNLINSTREYLSVVNEGVFINKITTPSQRDLAVSASILTELLSRAEIQQDAIAVYSRNLVNFRLRLDSLASDSVLLIIPSDPVLEKKYLQKIEVIVKESGPVDSTLTSSISAIQDLQNELDLMVFSIRSSLQEIERQRNYITTHALNRELPNLYSSSPMGHSLTDIIQSSVGKEFLALKFYLAQASGRIIMLVFLIGFGTYFLRSLKKTVTQRGRLDPDFKGQLVLRHPLLSAFLIVTSLFQFFFLSPPFIFGFTIWLLQAICLAFIFRGYISRDWMRFWIIMTILFVLASLDNFILQASLAERWILQILSIVGLGYGLYTLIWGRRGELRERGILYFAGFFIATQFVAFLLNLFGRYNLGKTLLTGGYAGFIIAIIFLWTVRFINESMSLASKTYRHSEKKSFFINFEKVGEKVPMIFYLLLVIGWCILVGRNFYGFRQMAEPFTNFLSVSRKLGSFSFNLQSVLVFFVIMFCSVLLSRLISFIASEPAETGSSEKNPPKVTLGSWLLLIRILIISFGLFFAFAATGIPLDRLTIVLGALSVGIGLGLQSLVTNLVSGLIIAFEKPVNVGDSIELDNKQGTMKSIGFRASTITMADGSILVVPNGDLLKGPLINWTLGKRARRLDVTVSVALGSDLEKVHELLNEILSKNESILRSPSPTVIAKEFVENTILFQVFFWADILYDSGLVKSGIIKAIDAAFRAEGIVIPNVRVDNDNVSIGNRQ